MISQENQKMTLNPICSVTETSLNFENCYVVSLTIIQYYVNNNGPDQVLGFEKLFLCSTQPLTRTKIL